MEKLSECVQVIFGDQRYADRVLLIIFLIPRAQAAHDECGSDGKIGRMEFSGRGKNAVTRLDPMATHRAPRATTTNALAEVFDFSLEHKDEMAVLLVVMVGSNRARHTSDDRDISHWRIHNRNNTPPAIPASLDCPNELGDRRIFFHQGVLSVIFLFRKGNLFDGMWLNSETQQKGCDSTARGNGS